MKIKRIQTTMYDYFIKMFIFLENVTKIKMNCGVEAKKY